jgi:hypothetical protein
MVRRFAPISVHPSASASFSLPGPILRSRVPASLVFARAISRNRCTILLPSGPHLPSRNRRTGLCFANSLTPLTISL